MKLQRSLVLKSCCWFPQQLSGSIGAHLSGYSHNTKHGCTLYNNLDCLLYLRVETDYITQLGRMCREVFVFSPFIQGLPHKNQFNDIVNVLGIFPPKPDTLFFLQLCSFTRLLNGNAGTLDASFLITCGSLTRSKKANATHQCVHSRASSSPVRQPCNKCFVMLIMQIFCCVEEVSTPLLMLMLDCNAKCRAAINLALLL